MEEYFDEDEFGDIDDYEKYLYSSDEDSDSDFEICWDDLEEYERPGGRKYLSDGFVYWDMIVSCCASLWSRVRNESISKDDTFKKTMQWLNSIQSFMDQNSSEKILSVSIKETIAEFLAYIGPLIKVNKKSSKKMNRLVKAIFNKVSNIVDERKIASRVRLPDHSSNDVSSTSSLLKSNEAVFFYPNNKDASASLQTVVEKLGCSKLDEIGHDDSVFEIDDEELSDEEEIIIDVMEIMIEEVLDRNLEGVKVGPFKYGAFELFIPCDWFPSEFPESGRLHVGVGSS